MRWIDAPGAPAATAPAPGSSWTLQLEPMPRPQEIWTAAGPHMGRSGCSGASPWEVRGGCVVFCVQCRRRLGLRLLPLKSGCGLGQQLLLSLGPQLSGLSTGRAPSRRGRGEDLLEPLQSHTGLSLSFHSTMSEISVSTQSSKDFLERLGVLACFSVSYRDKQPEPNSTQKTEELTWPTPTQHSASLGEVKAETLKKD